MDKLNVVQNPSTLTVILVPSYVIPAKAGIQGTVKLDSRLRGNDNGGGMTSNSN